jgi:hypothetical protein
MASAFFAWLRSPASREYFFSESTLSTHFQANNFYTRYTFLGSRGCLKQLLKTL